MQSAAAVIQILPRGPRGVGLAPDHEWSGTSIRFKGPDGTWGPFVNLIGQEGPAGTAQTFNSHAIAAGSIVSGGVDVIRVLGYYAAGGGGAADYARVGSEPGHPGKLQTADGAWWEIVEPDNLRQFGCKCDGATDDTAMFEAACTAFTALGVTHVRALGLCVTDFTQAIPSNLIFEGRGPDTGFKRKASSAVDGWFYIAGKSNVTFRNLKLDGNASNQSVTAFNVYFNACHNITLDGCWVVNAKALTSGTGVTFQDCTDIANDTVSCVTRCVIKDNGRDGISVRKSGSIHVLDNIINDNGQAGIDVSDFAFPPTIGTMDHLKIKGNQVRNNAGSALAVGGSTVIGGDASHPVFGFSSPATRGPVIEGNTLVGNAATTGYVLACGANGGTITGNVISGGALGVSPAAAVVLNSSDTIFVGNRIFSDVFGIDAGFSSRSVINDNVIIFGFETQPVGGINLGASSGSIVKNNIIHMGSHTGTGISMDGVDYSTDPLPSIGTSTVIEGNTIDGNGSATTGIRVKRNFSSATIRNNTVLGIADQYACYDLSVLNAVIAGNKRFIGGSPEIVVAAASTVVIPDEAEHITISGTTGIANIFTQSQNAFHQKIYDIQRSAAGSGYMPGSGIGSITATGGGGSGFAASMEIDGSGYYIGPLISNHGGGFTSTPALNFSGGGGIAAAGTAIVGCENYTDRILHVKFTDAVTLTDGGNLALNGNFTSNNVSTLTLRGNDGSWREMARSVN